MDVLVYLRDFSPIIIKKDPSVSLNCLVRFSVILFSCFFVIEIFLVAPFSLALSFWVKVTV